MRRRLRCVCSVRWADRLLVSGVGVSSSPSADPLSPPLEDPLIGFQVGEYRILEPVGEGGMGVVYRGVQPIIKKRVAIKVIKPAFASDASQVNRLVAEAEAVNAIGHRSIIDIFSLGTLPDGRPYIIMEFLEGEPLDTWLNRQGRPPLSIALELLVEMCGPLAAAHRAGVIHRDLKPSNIFLCSQPDGTKYLKLLDFGLAKRAMGLDGSSAQTSQAMVSGTPDYMAPEQARGMAISPRSDIYALGIVAFELLTGRVPFIGATPMDVMVSHVSKPAPRLRTFEPSLPEALDELVARMLAKEPEQRPQTIEEVRAVLEEVLVEGGAAPPRPSQTNLKRLSGFEAPRPATPPAPVQSVQVTPVPQPVGEPLPLPTGEPLPVVVGTVLDSGTAPAAKGAPPVLAPVPSGPRADAAPELTPLAAPVVPTPPPSSPRSARSTPGPGSPKVLGSNPSLSRVAAAPPATSRAPLVIAAVVGLVAIAAVAAWALSRADAPASTPPPPGATSAAGAAHPPPPTPTPSGEEPSADAPGVDLTTPTEPHVETPPDKVRPTTTKKRPAAPTVEALLKRITRLEAVAKKKNLGPNASSLLDAYRLQATAAESLGEREAVAKKLDGWEDAFLK